MIIWFHSFKAEIFDRPVDSLFVKFLLIDDRLVGWRRLLYAAFDRYWTSFSTPKQLYGVVVDVPGSRLQIVYLSSRPLEAGSRRTFPELSTVYRLI
jgi:hypothetical protein